MRRKRRAGVRAACKIFRVNPYPTLHYASDWVGVLGFNYDQPVGKNHVVLYANVNYQTRYNVSEINIPTTDVAGYALINAGVPFGGPDGLWDVAVIGKNLTNQFHPTAVNDRSFSPEWLVGCKGGFDARAGRDVGHGISVQLGGAHPRTIVACRLRAKST
jgi:hypothetical protein